MLEKEEKEEENQVFFMYTAEKVCQGNQDIFKLQEFLLSVKQCLFGQLIKKFYSFGLLFFPLILIICAIH